MVIIWSFKVLSTSSLIFFAACESHVGKPYFMAIHKSTHWGRPGVIKRNKWLSEKVMSGKYGQRTIYFSIFKYVLNRYQSAVMILLGWSSLVFYLKSTKHWAWLEYSALLAVDVNAWSNLVHDLLSALL